MERSCITLQVWLYLMKWLTAWKKLKFMQRLKKESEGLPDRPVGVKVSLLKIDFPCVSSLLPSLIFTRAVNSAKGAAMSSFLELLCSPGHSRGPLHDPWWAHQYFSRFNSNAQPGERKNKSSQCMSFSHLWNMICHALLELLMHVSLSPKVNTSGERDLSYFLLRNSPSFSSQNRTHIWFISWNEEMNE